MGASHLVAESVWKSVESTCSVTEEQLSILHFLFGKNFERATRIVDQRGVKRISGQPSGRSIFQVHRPPSILNSILHMIASCPTWVWGKFIRMFGNQSALINLFFSLLTQLKDGDDYFEDGFSTFT
ncbi:hypothetical protein SLEP1_g50544 [Rubroshorea leprosula]|uniref:Uncharacterized protein n=1 Tax=Rubroshorea leprosula TaxID=152421 RepID=A0AAV5M1T4_9ROSI|nr:hypothetical protein SLEP1_g50544 [Rubroshorea leprosula]